MSPTPPPRSAPPAFTSANGIAGELNRRGITTARGGRWQAVQVQRVRALLG